MGSESEKQVGRRYLRLKNHLWLGLGIIFEGFSPKTLSKAGARASILVSGA